MTSWRHSLLGDVCQHACPCFALQILPLFRNTDMFFVATLVDQHTMRFGAVLHSFWIVQWQSLNSLYDMTAVTSGTRLPALWSISPRTIGSPPSYWGMYDTYKCWDWYRETHGHNTWFTVPRTRGSPPGYRRMCKSSAKFIIVPHWDVSPQTWVSRSH